MATTPRWIPLGGTVRNPEPLVKFWIYKKRRRRDLVSRPRRRLKRTACDLEREPHADGGVDVVRLEGIAIGDAVVYAAPHGAGIAVEALGEGINRVQRDRVEGAAAVSGLIGAASGIGARRIGVLMVAVVCRRQIQSRQDGPANAGPIHFPHLVVGKGR